jgi:hypothetical protein
MKGLAQRSAVDYVAKSEFHLEGRHNAKRLCALDTCYTVGAAQKVVRNGVKVDAMRCAMMRQ